MKLALILSAAALSLAVVVITPAIAQESDYLCYWRRSDGTTANLSSLCNNTPKTQSPDAAFLADFRAMASQYPANVRQALENYINNYRDSAIASAEATCRVLKYGGTTAESTRRQRLAANTSSSSEGARLQIIKPLAINYYCPEFASR